MRKILLLLLFTLLSQGTIFAGHTPGNAGNQPPTGGGGADGHTPGTAGPPIPGTPIDTNKAVLVITAALIAGAAGYRRTSLKKA